MKTIIQYITLVLLVASSISTFAQDTVVPDINQLQKTVGELSDGNAYYANKEFEAAAESYEKILATDQHSATLYFNLGNTYYKMGEVTKAILNYERALLLAPDDDDIKFNLTLANKLTVDKIEQLPQPAIVGWWAKLVQLFSINTLSILVISCFAIFLILVVVYLFTKTATGKKVSFWLATLALLVWGIGIFAGVSQKQIILADNQAIITSPTLTVKAEPYKTGTSLFVIHEGLKVEIVETINGWHKIKIADGNIGWIPVDTAEVI